MALYSLKLLPLLDGLTLLKSYEACIRKFNKKSHRKYMLDDLDDQEIPYTCKTHTVFTSSSFNYRTSRKAENTVLGILPKLLHFSHGVFYQSKTIKTTTWYTK